MNIFQRLDQLNEFERRPVTEQTLQGGLYFARLLDVVGIYGLLLVPIGTIVVVEHWLFPRIGLTQYGPRARVC